MADRWMLALVLLLNVVAVSVLYSRISQTELGAQLQQQAAAFLTSLLSGDQQSTPHACGLLPWDHYIVASSRVVLPSGVQPAEVHVSNGKIVKVVTANSVGAANSTGAHSLQFGDAVVSPGVIDVHVHLNEPGRLEWEGIPTGTRAALYGGVTTIIDMPLNSYPTTTVASRLLEKQGLAKEKALVSIGHWAGLVPENAAKHDVLAELLAAGALGFKSFMSPSGIADFPNVHEADIAAALPFVKSAGVPFYIHAELTESRNQGDPNSTAEAEKAEEGMPWQYATYEATRPPSFEREAISLLIRLLDADTTPAMPGFKLHIAHLSDAGSLALIADARARGHPISVETCPHYLSFVSEEIPDGDTLFKCAPPIRDKTNRQALLAAVLDGSINLIASDHSPAPPQLKRLDTGDFIKAWGGISGLQYILPATWTALKAQGGSLQDLARLLSYGPAQLTGLEGHGKGKIEEGFDADFVVWEPEQLADTSKKGNMHHHNLSPYTDRELLGRVITTIVNGRVLRHQGKAATKPCGAAQVLMRGAQQQHASAKEEALKEEL